MTKTIIVKFRHVGQICRKCEKELIIDSSVIAARGVNKTKYYHESCYEKLFFKD